MVEQLKRLRASGYRYVFFGSDDPRYAWAVDMVFPGNDYCTIDAAIADISLLRGRSVHGA